MDKDYEMTSYFLGIYIRIRMASRESSGKKKVIHFGIPRSGSLIETIKRFLKVTNKDKVILDIARRLFHVDFFLQISMQEGGFNVHLMDLPFM
jgi:adenylate kinase family enzyme